MIQLEIFVVLFFIALVLMGTSLIDFRKKQVKQGLRLTGAVLFLLNSYLMLEGIGYNSGAVITETAANETVVVNTNEVYENQPMALVFILTSLLLILATLVDIYNNRYDEEEKT